MNQHSTPRTVTTGSWLAPVTTLAVVVGIVALFSTVVVAPSPSRAQDALARIPVSTATPYPYATTATPWKSRAPAAATRGPSPAQSSPR
ncbi:MAG: hypothetical protein ABIQ53_15365 [Terracoccus sp.]